ncbi:class I heat shock protein [Sesamum alatum]|uniref:Class I heat shock protein n=1 Tax=Sesamum alatum TaxID=300844 RepID=A0AAE2CC74_9LAMI|nr:class I heat shock protein [Sesamum alatum]
MSLIPSVFGRRSSVLDPFSLDLWDPFRDWPVSSSDETSQLAATRIDWKETPEAHVFKADVPGLKKEEVKVEVEDGNVLQISGERSVRRGEERHMAPLPENAKMDQIKASMENGVLTVTVPKEEVKQPEVKAIEISG